MEELHNRKKGLIHVIKDGVAKGSDSLGERALNDIRIILKEAELFLGVTLSLVGLLRFSSDKFCDGNSVDYLSCTRPSAFHYYGGFEIFLIIVGTFLILLWFLKRRREL